MYRELRAVCLSAPAVPILARKHFLKSSMIPPLTRPSCVDCTFDHEIYVDPQQPFFLSFLSSKLCYSLFTYYWKRSMVKVLFFNFINFLFTAKRLFPAESEVFFKCFENWAPHKKWPPVAESLSINSIHNQGKHYVSNRGTDIVGKERRLKCWRQRKHLRVHIISTLGVILSYQVWYICHRITTSSLPSNGLR